MKQLALLLACLSFVTAAAAGNTPIQPPKTLRVAVITGGHGFDEKEFPKLFAPDTDLAVSILTQKDDSEIFEDISAWPYDVIVLYNMGQRISEKRQANFLALLDRGVGLVALHHSVAAFQEWPEFQNIIGCHYYIDDKTVNGVTHSKSAWREGIDMKVAVADATHPVTQGVTDFSIHDEGYYQYTFDPGVHVLLTVDHPNSAKIVALAKTSRNANVCYIQPGHGPLIFTNPNYQRLVAQAIRWAAQGPARETPGLSDLSAFREPLGDWLIAGEAFLDPQDEKKLAWKSGTGAVVNGPKGRTNHLVTKAEFGDVELHVEFMVPKDSNSGVYLQGRYEIQVLDSWGVEHPKYGDCGGIYQRWHEEKGLQESERGYEGRPPKVNASRKPGEWQSFDILFRAPRFDASGKKTANAAFVSVLHNGVLVHENEEVSGPTRAALFEDEQPLGPLMLQGDHGPVAYRNLRITPLAAGTKALAPDLYGQLAAYDFGQSHEALAAIEREIESAPPAHYPEIEERLLRVVSDASASFAAKEFACRMLQRTDSEKAVPVLAPMLTDEVAAHIARMALERIPGESVDAALLSAMKQTSGNLKVGLINTLGERRKTEYVDALAPVLEDADTAIAEAVAAALGKIGGDKALAALNKARQSGSTGVHEAASRACLSCASALLAQERYDAACGIFDEVFAANESAPVHAAAFSGRVRARGAAGAGLLIEALKGEEPELAATALRLARELPGAALTEQLADLVPLLSGERKALLMEALGDRADQAALPAVLAAVTDNDEDVRAAACRAAGLLGEASAVPALLAAAAGTGKESNAARESLARLRGEGVDESLAAVLKAGDTTVTKEAIQALAARQAVQSAPLLLGLARDSDPGLRREAINALTLLAGAEQMPALVDLLVNPLDASERPALETALVATAQRAKGDEQRTSPLSSALSTTSDNAVKCSILSVLGKIGDSASLASVRTALQEDQPEVNDAAARALSAWPSPEPLNDLLMLARGGRNETQKTLALRGYVRLLNADPGMSARNRLSGYTEALTLAKQDGEKRAILAGLGTVPTVEALNMAFALLENEGLRAEAASAVLKIAEAVAATQPEAARTALQGTMECCKDDRVTAQAQTLLAKLRWQALQPFNIAEQGQASSPDGLEKDGGAGDDRAAIDGNPQTYWDETDGQPLYRLQVNFPEPKEVAAISILGYRHQDYAPKDFEVLCDGNTVKSVRNAAYSDNLFLTEFPTQTCKIVELRITGSHGGSPAVRELGIYPALPATT